MVRNVRLGETQRVGAGVCICQIALPHNHVAWSLDVSAPKARYLLVMPYEQCPFGLPKYHAKCTVTVIIMPCGQIMPHGQCSSGFYHFPVTYL